MVQFRLAKLPLEPPKTSLGPILDLFLAVLDLFLAPFWSQLARTIGIFVGFGLKRTPKTLFLGAITVHFGYKSGTFVYTKFNVRI